MIQKLTHIFSKHCDLDRAARNYKTFYAIGGSAWGSRTLMQIYGTLDIAQTLQQQDHPFSLMDLFNGSELSLKFAAYSVAWAVLKGCTGVLLVTPPPALHINTR